MRRVPLLVLGMAVAWGIPAARAQKPPEVWSIQLHGGMFTAIDASGASPTVGMRYAKHFTSHIQGGLLTGLTMKRKSVETPATEPPGNDSSIELARVDAKLVPVMAFMQVNLTEKFFVVPFLGIGAGYEWLVLDIVDHRTGAKHKNKYDNVAWEAYGGVGLRLTRDVRLNGELYYNGGSLERVVKDSSGWPWHEAVHVNGVGARVGLDMNFQ